MADEVDHWRSLAARLGFELKAPACVPIAGESVTFTAHLPQFGSEMGMIADPDGHLMSRYATALVALGYGYSVVELGGNEDVEGAQEMLRDWGWTATQPKPSWW
jgi:hypothetical protein